MTTETNKAPGMTGLLIMIVLILSGGGGLWIVDSSLDAWPMAAAAGWSLAGLLGVTSWLSARKAFRVGPQAFFKVVFGGMFLRMLALGLAAGLVLGFDWLDTIGFAGGIGAGLIVFQIVEIASLSMASGTASAEAEHAR